MEWKESVERGKTTCSVCRHKYTSINSVQPHYAMLGCVDGILLVSFNISFTCLLSPFFILFLFFYCSFPIPGRTDVMIF